MEYKICICCGKVFESKPTSTRLFCGRRCEISKVTVPKESRICAYRNCGNVFKCRINDTEQYCSHICSTTARRGVKLSRDHIANLSKSMMGKNKLPAKLRLCARDVCDNTFEVSITSKRKFCSRYCSSQMKRAPREERTCKYVECNNVFICKVKDSKKFCSLLCTAKHNKGNQSFTGHCHSKETLEKISNTMSLLQLKGLVRKSRFETGNILLPRLKTYAHYRSSYEKKALFLLDTCLDTKNISCESVRIAYMDSKRVQHYYIPDYLVTTEKGLSYIIEVKPDYLFNTKENQLKFKAACDYVEKHNMIFLIWTEFILFNNNGSTTASLQEIAEATVATLSDGKVMIQSELCRKA